MSEIEQIVEELTMAFEGEPWHGPALMEIVADVDAKAASAHPIAEAHSIWELVLHIAAWERAINTRIVQRKALQLNDEENFPAVTGGSEAAWRHAIEMLNTVRIASAEKRVQDYPHHMSGGMRQRVMIAMALSCTPKLLIADEPTTALDVTIQAQILDLLRDLQKEFRMSIIMITHDLGVVAEICENVVVMYAGKVVEEAPVRGIFNNSQHPYTEGLLRSIPHLGMTSAAKLAVIRGTVPSAVNWPPGCRFAPRCNYRFEKCVEDPPLFDVGGQTSACWLCEGGRRQTAARSTHSGES